MPSLAMEVVTFLLRNGDDADDGGGVEDGEAGPALDLKTLSAWSLKSGMILSGEDG